MKKYLVIIVAIVAVVALWVVVKYNNFVKAAESMNTAWGQVENVYQRRADLIPNLVAVVKDYADFEQETILAVTEARAKATATTISVNGGDEGQFQAFENAQDALGQSLNRLLATIEAYPELKANEQYLTLQAQLSGCENRILVERNRFNEQAKAYNQSIRRFPGSIVANMFGFEKRPYFAASEGADVAPQR